MTVHPFISALFGAAMLSSAASSGWAGSAFFMPPEQLRAGSLQMEASNNCNALGQQTAQSLGGDFHSATIEVQNGRQVCVIIVLIPARDGNRGQRERVVIPL